MQPTRNRGVRRSMRVDRVCVSIACQRCTLTPRAHKSRLLYTLVFASAHSSRIGWQIGHARAHFKYTLFSRPHPCVHGSHARHTLCTRHCASARASLTQKCCLTFERHAGRVADWGKAGGPIFVYTQKLRNISCVCVPRIQPLLACARERCCTVTRTRYLC